MNKPPLTITITGAAGSGKSLLAAALRDLFHHFGIACTVTDSGCDAGDMARMAWTKLEHLRGHTVAVVTHQSSPPSMDTRQTIYLGLDAPNAEVRVLTPRHLSTIGISVCDANLSDPTDAAEFKVLAQDMDEVRYDL